eukprot:m51a1_g9751 hypothetical protein (217) ;mRNA; f:1597331-1598346
MHGMLRGADHVPLLVILDIGMLGFGVWSEFAVGFPEGAMIVQALRRVWIDWRSVGPLQALQVMQMDASPVLEGFTSVDKLALSLHRLRWVSVFPRTRSIEQAELDSIVFSEALVRLTALAELVILDPGLNDVKDTDRYIASVGVRWMNAFLAEMAAHAEWLPALQTLAIQDVGMRDTEAMQRARPHLFIRDCTRDDRISVKPAEIEADNDLDALEN